MPTGIEIVRAIEAEVGFKLKPKHLHDLMYLGSSGYHLNPDGELTGLAITRSKLKQIPKAIDHAKQLTHLNLSDNQISDINPIAQLHALTTLSLSNNQINDINPITQLHALTRLNLDSNQINEINPIAQLHALTSLDLENNQINDISLIAHLNALVVLDINNNQIADINPILDLPNLKVLYANNNNIQTLPKSFAAFNRRCDVYLNNNPLVFPPPEIIEQGHDAVDAFFEQTGPTSKLNEVKVLLVGEGGAGKTSLVKRLFNQPHDPNEDTTHGIRIRDWRCDCDGSDFRVRLWDFGGQEVYHATHRFFLSARCIYVVVLDGRRDERVEYWLRHAQNYGGDAPVLVVMNKIDQNPAFDLNRNDLMQRYPQIRGFFPTSCAKSEGIAPLITALQAYIPRVPLHAITWPSSWLKVKQAMEGSGEPYLNRTAFLKLCRGYGVSERETSQVLIQLLHDLGVAIHFDEFEMDEMFVLDPLWVTAAIYRILRSETVAKKDGMLDLNNDLIACLREPNPSVADDRPDYDFPRALLPYLIKLMEKFELCFRIQGKDQILLPNLLPENEKPLSFNDQDPLLYRINYAFLPPTLMPSLMVLRHEDIDGDLRWRTGVVFINDARDTRAVVRAYKEDRVVAIRVYGPHKQALLTSLRHTLHKIHKRSKHNEINSYIACSCAGCKQEVAPFYHDVDAVVGMAIAGKSHVTCNSSYEDLPIRQMLDSMDYNLAPALLEVEKQLERDGGRLSFLEEAAESVSLKFAGFGFSIDAAKLIKIWRNRRR